MMSLAVGNSLHGRYVLCSTKGGTGRGERVQGFTQRVKFGSLLFLIYINDVTCVISNGKITIYADDNSPVLNYSFSHGLHTCAAKCSAWVDHSFKFLLLNTLKCCHLLFSRKNSSNSLSPAPARRLPNFNTPGLGVRIIHT